MSEAEPRRVLAVANETVTSAPLIGALQRRAGQGPINVTVVCPINPPSAGYVVYEDTRRAAAGRRLQRTLESLRAAGIPAQGSVVDAEPADAVRDTLRQERIDEVVVSTHPLARSGWLRRNAIDGIRRAAGDTPVEHVVVEADAAPAGAHVLVLANETVVGEALLERIRDRASRSPASFLLVSPQSDPTRSAHPEAERRLRRALSELRADGLDAHGQVAHPDPYTAAMTAIREERVDELIVSTFSGERSGWLRRDLIARLRKDTGRPVEHVVVGAGEVVRAS